MSRRARHDWFLSHYQQARRSAAKRWSTAGPLPYSRQLRIEPLEDRRLLALVTINTLSDTVDVNDGVTSLREAIFATNLVGGADTIEFSPTLTAGGPATILLTHGELKITESLTINGPGANLLTIDASSNDPTSNANDGNGSRVFNIDDGNSGVLSSVMIRGLTLTGGDSQLPGGAIAARENLTVVDSTITGNATRSGGIMGGGGIYSSGGAALPNSLTVHNSLIVGNSSAYIEGGGIRKRFGSLVIDGSTISGNSALEAGGGVSASESVTVAITNSTISNNHVNGAGTAYDGGGGLFLFRATTTISGSTISGNNSGVDGGGIYNYNGNLSVTDSTISGNSTANGDGGGILGRYGNIFITRSTISGNMAISNEPYPYSHGGGIYHRGTSNNSITVTASTIEGNSANHGGGIWKRTSRLTLTDTTIHGNGSTAGGGGITSLYGIVTANRSTISDNVGGGIRAISGSVSVTTSTISGNSAAGRGGGIYGGSVTVTDSTISSNSAGEGGGVFSFGLTLSGSTVSGNTADRDGGGIFHGFGNITVTNSIVSGNSAQRGGGMYFNFANLTATASTISGNSASESGGGVFGGSTLNFSGSTIRDNSAGASGGGVYSYGGTSVTLTNSAVSGNSAGGHGGGMYVKDAYNNLDTMTVSNSTISGNSAGRTGGGIWFRSSGTMTVANSTISGNSATSGGGVYMVADVAATFNLRHSTVAFNSATNVGGGMTVFGGTLALDHALLASNTATFGPDLTNLFSAVTVHYSLIGSNSGIPLAEAPLGLPDANGNLVGGPVGGLINPLLGPLVDNGGPTWTHALLAGSPALDAGNASAVQGVGTVPARDQRGTPFARVFDNDGVGGARIDIGAYERQTVPALSLVVSTLVDESDGNYSTGDFSLREAIGLANGSVGANTITFAASLTADGPKTIRLTRGELRILDSVAIQGPGAAKLTIDAVASDPTPELDNGDGSRVFNFDDGTGTLLIVSLSGVTLTGGDVIESGGGILTRENLSVADSTISGNSVSGKNGGGYTIGRGGGIYSNGNLTVTGSTISGNSVGGYGGGGGQGGGISIRYGNLTLAGSTISGNSATGSGGNDGYGGGIFQRFGNVTVTNSTLSGNSAGEDGGAIRIRGGQLFITTSTLSDNSAGTNGGGIWGDFVVDVTSSTVSGNSAGGSGGAILGSLMRLTSSTISGNSAGDFGGGIAGDLRFLYNSTVSGNSAGRDGGGIWESINAGIPTTLNNNTIVGNKAGGSGGGISTPYPMDLSHTIVAQNTQGAGAANDVTGPVSLAFSLLGVNTGAAVTNNGGNLIGSAGSPIDPRLAPLADNGGPTATHALLSASPAINAGSLTPFSPPNFDQRGAPYQRIRGGRIDIGAHESQDLTVAIQDVGSPRVVSVDGVTIQFSSVVSGFDLADLELSLNGGANRLAGGQTLTTNDNRTFLLGGLTAITADSGYYTLTLGASGSGIADAGGGPLDAGDTTSWAMGRAELGLTVNTLVDEMDGSLDDGDISLRDALAAAAPGETIDFDASLDGGTILLTLGELSSTRSLSIDATLLPSGITIDASGNDPTPDANDGNGSRVLAFDDGNSLADSLVTIYGVTLTGGDTRGDGGAIFARDTLTIIGSTIVGNSADVVGGGIRGFGTVTVNSSTISGNSAGLSGGGIFAFDAVTVDASTISGNSATSSYNSAQGGGGIRSLGSVTVTASTISDNSAGDSGGGIFATGPVTVASSTISGNSARGGGGIYNYGNGSPSGTMTVTNSTISGNTAQFGGGIVGRNLMVTNSTVSGNLANTGGGIVASGAATVISSTISGNSASEGGGIWISGNSGLTLISSTVSGNSANSRGGGILSFSSVTVTNSTIFANSAGGSGGGGIWAEYAPLTIRNSIVAGNSDTASSPDLRPAMGLLNIDYSLIGNNAGTGLAEAPLGQPDAKGNLIGGLSSGSIDPLLGPLANNGGRTMTHALLVGSPAIDAGDPSAVAGIGGVPQFDQRGGPWSRVSGGRIDIGAFESQVLSPAAFGDYDDDGFVGTADYTVWRNTLGSTSDLRADGNDDGVVNNLDYAIWKTNFGETLPLPVAGSGAATITLSEPVAKIGEPFAPEPATSTVISHKAGADVARVAGIAPLELHSVNRDSSPRRRERNKFVGAAESVGDNLLLMLAIDRLGHSSQQEFSEIDNRRNVDPQPDELDSQCHTDNPFEVALAEWR